MRWYALFFGMVLTLGEVGVSIRRLLRDEAAA